MNKCNARITVDLTNNWREKKTAKKSKASNIIVFSSNKQNSISILSEGTSGSTVPKKIFISKVRRNQRLLTQ